MEETTGKSDLRVVKTTKILNKAMLSILKHRSFRKLTVRDICEEAQISRATFYARYADKYDFLKHWLTFFMPKKPDLIDTYEGFKNIHNDHFIENKELYKNLITDTDGETLEILAEFILGYFIPEDKRNSGQSRAEQVVLSSFFAGGMIFYVLWQIKHHIPTDVHPINAPFFELVKRFREWRI